MRPVVAGAFDLECREGVKAGGIGLVRIMGLICDTSLIFRAGCLNVMLLIRLDRSSFTDARLSAKDMREIDGEATY